MQWWNRWRRRDEAQPEAADAIDLLLSSYLDGEVTARERAAIERRLGDEAALRDALEDLRAVVLELGRLDGVAAPRVFAVTADALPRRHGLTRLELGVRAGAVAAVAAFVFAIGVDALGGGPDGIRGQAAPLRSAIESGPLGSTRTDGASTTSSAGGASSEAAAAPDSGAASTAEDASTQPTVIPTGFAVQPAQPLATSASTPLGSQRQQAPPGTTPTPAAAVTRTPPAVTSTSTMTSALQGTGPAGTPTPALSASAGTPAAAAAPAAPAIAPAGSPTSTPVTRAIATATVTVTITSTATPPARPTPTPVTSGESGGGSSGANAGGAAPALPATPTTAPEDERESAPAVAPPSTRGAGGNVAPSEPREALPNVPATDGSGWGAGTLRVSVAREEGIDGLRTAQIGLGALALGLGGMTGWLWYVRRREAVAGGV